MNFSALSFGGKVSWINKAQRTTGAKEHPAKYLRRTDRRPNNKKSLV